MLYNKFKIAIRHGRPRGVSVLLESRGTQQAPVQLNEHSRKRAEYIHVKKKLRIYIHVKFQVHSLYTILKTDENAELSC